MAEKKASKGMTAAETKELRRVFDHLANFLPKQDIYKRLSPYLDRKTDLVAYHHNPDAIEVKDDDGNVMDADAVDAELEVLNTKVEELQSTRSARRSANKKRFEPKSSNLEVTPGGFEPPLPDRKSGVLGLTRRWDQERGTSLVLH